MSFGLGRYECIAHIPTTRCLSITKIAIFLVSDFKDSVNYMKSLVEHLKKMGLLSLHNFGFKFFFAYQIDLAEYLQNQIINKKTLLTY